LDHPTTHGFRSGFVPRYCKPSPNRLEPAGKQPRRMGINSSPQGNKAMTITKTALAAAILAVMAVSAQAQQGPTRQIQVLPAPVKVAKAPAIVDQGPAKVEGEAPQIEAPAADNAPAADEAPQDAAPQVVAPKIAPKVIVAAPVIEKPAPRFVEPKFAPPVHKAYYGGYYRKGPICH